MLVGEARFALKRAVRGGSWELVPEPTVITLRSGAKNFAERKQVHGLYNYYYYLKKQTFRMSFQAPETRLFALAPLLRTKRAGPE